MDFKNFNLMHYSPCHQSKDLNQIYFDVLSKYRFKIWIIKGYFPKRANLLENISRIDLLFEVSFIRQVLFR